MHTVVARLACDEKMARALASVLDETLDPDDTAAAAFADDGGRWQMAVYFRAQPDEAAVRALVHMAAGADAAAALAFEALDETDWVAESLAGLGPVRAGRFVVHGSHDRARVPVNALGIEIEAALAFGTGHHGTTRGCLLALDALAKRRRHTRVPLPARDRMAGAASRAGARKNRKKTPTRTAFGGSTLPFPGRDRKENVLDIGTGSGVLAIAAARRLRATVIASDIDRRAVAAARENARLNGVASYVTTVHAAGAYARSVTRPAPYDLVFANILLGPLIRLAQPIRRLAAPGARVVLSGLLPAHANAALAVYRAQGLVLERRIPLQGWMTLVLKRGR